MRALLLDPDSVDRERRVIEEELAMAEDDPWDALEQAVFRALFPRHAYGRPVLGRRADLRRTDSDDLDEFHRRRYRPANAVLAIAGADPADALARTRDVFAAVPPRPPQAPGGPRRRRPARSGRRPRSSRRLTRYAGETARLMIGLPAPAGDDPQLPQVDLLLAVLATGRSSRLQRSLVDGGLCAFVGAQVAAMRERGAALLTAELLPGTVPQQVEAMLLAALDDLAKAPPKRAEIARVRRMMVADWIFAHERVHQQAVATAMAVGLFDAGHPLRQAGRLLAAGQDALADAGRRWLDPARGSVIGWSLPLSDAS